MATTTDSTAAQAVVPSTPTTIRRWWHAHLSPEQAGSNSLRAGLRRQSDAALLLEPAVVELLASVSAVKGRPVSYAEGQALVDLVRLLGDVRADASTPLARGLATCSNGGNLSAGRLRAIVTAPDQRGFAYALRQVLPLLDREASVQSVAGLFLGWPFEDTRKRFAFDIYSNIQK